MKLSHRARKIGAAFATLLAVMAAGAGVAYAADQSVNVSGTTDRTIYKFGRDISISGTVNGDIICAGENITIDATVNGDVICAGQDVSVNGPINGSVRLAGQNVVLRGTVERNASLAGQNITVSGRVNNDAGLAGSDITVSGQIGRDSRMAGNDLTLSGRVGRNLTSNAGDLTLTNSAVVAGTVIHTGPRAVHKSNGADVGGKLVYHQKENKKFNWGWLIGLRLYIIIALTLFSVILVALLPGLFRRLSAATAGRFWWVLLTGFLSLFIVPIIIAILAATVVGLIPALLLLMLWLAAIILSAPFAAYFLGKRIAPNWHPVLAVLVGSLIIGILYLVPILGEIVAFIALIIGLGTLLWGLRSGWRRPEYARS